MDNLIICSACGIEAERSRPRSGQCRPCYLAKARAYANRRYAEKGPQILARQKELRQANLEEERRKDRESNRKYVAANPEKARAWRATAESKPDYKERKSASAKRHYQASKDQIKARVNLYRAQNIDAVRERGRKYYAANAERRKQYERDYRAANPEKMRAANAIKKAHRRSLGRIPYGWFRKQLVIQNHRCNGCLVGLTTDGSTKATLDHIQPVRDGGTNAADNLQILCFACNMNKKARPWQQWLAERHGRLL